MSAEEFRSKLAQLGYAKPIDLSSLEWLVEDPNIAPFVQWFVHETDDSNYLTPDEVQRYEALQASGQRDVPNEGAQAAVPSEDRESIRELEAEVEKLSQELEQASKQLEMATLTHARLSTRCMDQLRRNEKLKQTSAVATAKLQEELRTCGLLNADMNAAFTEVGESLADAEKLVDRALEGRKGTSGAGGNSTCFNYLTFLPMDEFHFDDKEHNETLRAYIRKQFPEKVNQMAEVGTESQYQMIDLRNPSPSSEQMSTEQLQFCSVLKNLRDSLVQVDDQSTKAFCSEQGLVEEVKVAEKFLEALQRGVAPHWPTISLKVKENEAAIERLKAAQAPSEWEAIQQLIRDVAEMTSTVAITGNYQLKWERQNCIISRLDKTIEYLLQRQAINQFLSWALKCEKHAFIQVQQMIGYIGESLIKQADSFHSRMVAMERFGAAIEMKLEQQNSGTGLMADLQKILGNVEPAPGRAVAIGQARRSWNLLSASQVLLKEVCSLRETAGVDRDSVDVNFQTEMQELHKLHNGLKDLQEAVWSECSTVHGPPLLTPLAISKAIQRYEKCCTKLWHAYLAAVGKFKDKSKIINSNLELDKRRKCYVDFYKQV